MHSNGHVLSARAGDSSWYGLMSLLNMLLLTLAVLAGRNAWAAPDACTSSPPQGREGQGGRPPAMGACFDTVKGKPVLWLYGGIGNDSAANVHRALMQSTRYREVWLNSPGGSVSEAFSIGRDLQRMKATVRVPKIDKVWCVSACTILIVGGYNRIVEPGAAFLVHAPSAVLQMNGQSDVLDLDDVASPCDKAITYITADCLVAIAVQKPKDAGLFLRKAAEDRMAHEWMLSFDTIVYYQQMLEGAPDMAAYAAQRQRVPPSIYEVAGSARRDLRADIADVQSNGLTALQEILTQGELYMLRAASAGIRGHEGEFGRGAKSALRMFDAMITCRIQDECLLTQHQLASLGYHNYDED